MQPLYTFNWLVEGQRLINQLVKQFELCPKLCFIQKDNDTCVGVKSESCHKACEQKETPAAYNERVQRAIAWLEEWLPTFALVDEGNQTEEQSCILMEKGKFYGMGYVPTDMPIMNRDELKNYLVQYPESDYIRGLVYQYAEKNPKKKIAL